jgi:hypothetical protein
MMLPVRMRQFRVNHHVKNERRKVANQLLRFCNTFSRTVIIVALTFT